MALAETSETAGRLHRTLYRRTLEANLVGATLAFVEIRRWVASALDIRHLCLIS
jgi:hypothetical protein